MSGYIGDLSKSQESALDELTEKIDNCITDEHIYSYSQEFVDDIILLKFLRARSFDVEQAFAMLVDTLKFRLNFQGKGVDVITPLDATNEINFGKSFYHKTDKQGRPVCIIKPACHDPTKTNELESQRFTILQMEHAKRILKPPGETVTIIFDMSGCTLKNMDLKTLRFMIQMLQSHYPESLGKVLVYNSSWIVNGMWKVVKPWLDPVTANKVVFAAREEMKEYIEEKSLLIEYGGTDDYKYDPKKYIELLTRAMGPQM